MQDGNNAIIYIVLVFLFAVAIHHLRNYAADELDLEHYGSGALVQLWANKPYYIPYPYPYREAVWNNPTRFRYGYPYWYPYTFRYSYHDYVFPFFWL